MSYTVNLYSNSSNNNVMNKSITLLATYECEFKNDVDVENPVIYLSAGDTVDGCNYMYIPEFGRYYYAKAITKKGTAIEIQGQSDPLMSFRSAILASKAVIARNPWQWDKYLPDGKMPVESRTIRSTFEFPNKTHFSGTDNCYVLVTLGPGPSST